MVERLTELLGQRGALAAAGGAALGLVLALGAAAAITLHLPARFLAGEEPGPLVRAGHPLLAVLARLGQGLLGLLLVLLGLITLLPGFPGPGLLFTLLGALVLEVPGSHQLVRRVLRGRRVLGMVNRVRRRFGRAPLEPASGRFLARRPGRGQTLRGPQIRRNP